MSARLQNIVMHSPTISERPRKRRAINACISCRSSKVRCDGKQPCERCDRNDAVCQYHNAAGRDPNTLRIEILEAEVARLQHQIKSTEQISQTQRHLNITQHSTRREFMQRGGMISPQTHIISNAVERGLVAYDEAFAYFTRYCYCFVEANKG